MLMITRMPTGRVVLALAVLAQGLIGARPEDRAARASDAPLQHALKEAGCISPVLKQVWQRGDLTAFKANCAATSHRVLIVICDKRACNVGSPDPVEEAQ